jgi:hypothetical protein
MKKMIVALMVMALATGGLAAGSSTVARAQTGSNPPPTIVTFFADLLSITLAEAEAGQTPVALSWRTLGVASSQRVVISTYRLTRWVPISEEGAPLPPSGSIDLLVQHPLNFGPPTYLLAIVDEASNVLDQRVLTIPYAVEVVGVPLTIEVFSSPVKSLDINAVTAGAAQVPLGWRVTGRLPNTNLQFDQVLDDGSAVSVELPRANLWVPSEGEGVVVPLIPGPDRTITLRLRVVDLQVGEVLAEEYLAPISLTGTVPVPAPVPTATPVQTTLGPSDGSPLRVDYFTVTPSTVTRGGTVTVSWQVVGASRLAIWRADPEGRLAEAATDVAATGSWTLDLSEVYVSGARFLLFAADDAGNELEASTSVQVVCPHAYFFGQAAGSTCPAGDEATVQAAYQPFQNGFMVWRADSSEIFVFYQNSGQVGRYRDTWQGEYFPEEPPPPYGLIQPQRGFGKVWYENQPVRDGLGYGIAPEAGYTMVYQRSADLRYSRLYLTLPDGRVIYVVENTWGLERP